MPTYEYLCNACGHRFEKFQSITSEPVRICPKCSKNDVTRLMSGGTGLIFKGSGFYITDYKNSKTSPSTSTTETKKPEPKKEINKTEPKVKNDSVKSG